MFRRFDALCHGGSLPQRPITRATPALRSLRPGTGHATLPPREPVPCRPSGHSPFQSTAHHTYESRRCADRAPEGDHAWAQRMRRGTSNQYPMCTAGGRSRGQCAGLAAWRPAHCPRGNHRRRCVVPKCSRASQFVGTLPMECADPHGCHSFAPPVGSLRGQCAGGGTFYWQCAGTFRPPGTCNRQTDNESRSRNTAMKYLENRGCTLWGGGVNDPQVDALDGPPQLPHRTVPHAHGLFRGTASHCHRSRFSGRAQYGHSYSGPSRTASMPLPVPEGH